MQACSNKGKSNYSEKKSPRMFFSWKVPPQIQTLNQTPGLGSTVFFQSIFLIAGAQLATPIAWKPGLILATASSTWSSGLTFSFYGGSFVWVMAVWGLVFILQGLQGGLSVGVNIENPVVEKWSILLPMQSCAGLLQPKEIQPLCQTKRSRRIVFPWKVPAQIQKR